MRLPAVLLACLALPLAACGADPEPTPPRAGVVGQAGGGGGGGGGGGARPRAPKREFDPVPGLLSCLKRIEVPARRTGDREVGVGDPATRVRVVLLATEGETQTAQLQGQAEGAEVLGRALLFVGLGSDAFLRRVEPCASTAGNKE